MTDAEINRIIRENTARRHALFAPYDPITGVGSPIERMTIEFSAGGNEFEWGIPLTMYHENEALITAITNHHSIESVLSDYGVSNDPASVDIFLRELINQRFRYDFEFWAYTTAKITDKETKQQIPFKLRKPQRKVLVAVEEMRLANKPIRIIIDKARQWGGSTFVQIYMGWIQLIHRTGWHSSIVADIEKQARNIRAMYGRLVRGYPVALGSFKMTPYEGSTNDKFIQERQCAIIIGSAQKPDSIRSFDLAMCHQSEVAYWKTTQNRSAEDLAQSIRAAVAQVPYSLVALESTARGVGNFFHREWLKAMSGESDYKPIFVAWFEIELYQKAIPEGDMPGFVKWMQSDPYALYLWQLGATLEGIKWYFDFRRGEGYDDWRMKSEYPSTCIAKGTRVGTNLGIIPIENCNVAKATNTGDIVGFFNNGIKDIYRLTTSYGYELRCTSDHLIKIINDDGIISWRKFDEVICGDSIVLAIPKFADEIYVYRWKEDFVDHSITITPEMGRFLGVFMGDGSYSDQVLSVACDARDTDFIESISNSIKDLLGIELHPRFTGINKGCCEIRAKKKSLTKYFAEIGIIEKQERSTGYIRKVCVPDIIWMSPKHVVKEFLRGIFETDGFNGWDVPKIGLFSKHIQFLKDIQLLLLGFGITSIIRQRPAHTNQYHYIANTLILQGEQADLFRDNIGFISNRKQSRFATWKIRDKGRRTKNRLKDKVTNIEHIGLEEVYDLTIKDSHEFSANGILVHNCQESFQQTGSRVFAPHYVENARRNVMKPEFIGSIRGKALRGKEALENIELIKDDRGLLYIWSMPDKSIEVSNRYLVSMDIGGRTHTADYTVMRVFDRYWMMDGGKPEIAATWRGHIDQDIAAWIAVQICKLYNNAFFIPESNSYDKTSEMAEGDHFFTILDEIVKYYSNIYARTDPDKVRQGLPLKYGFHTNASSKPMIIDHMNGVLRDDMYVEHDERSCDEMDTFEIKPNGRYAAIEGCHDDIVMPTAIGLWGCFKYLPMPKEIQPRTGHRRKGRITEATI